MDSPRANAPLRRRVLGSALSAFAGWFTINALQFVIAAVRDPSLNEWWLGMAVMTVYSAMFVGATWLLALLPLYLLVPLPSRLWRWYVCTPCGAVAGAAIMYGFLRYDSSQSDLEAYILMAAITGGATCLFGSLTLRWFQYRQIQQHA